jgi:hypothetical protein
LKKLFARLVRQSPSMIVAMLALFVAMGGTAIAASSALITGKQIKNSSITGADVKNKSLTPRDFRGSVRGPRGPVGGRGPAGPVGPVGPAGAPNPNAVNSDKLDDLDSTDFLRSNAKAADSEKVDGYEANGIARLEGTTFSGIPGTTSLPFTAPSAGRAVLDAMCWGSAGGTAIQVQFGLGTGGSTSFYYHNIAANQDAMLVARRVVTVIAGTTYTFSVSRAYQVGSGGNCLNGSFSVLFVPFKLDGTS